MILARPSRYNDDLGDTLEVHGDIDQEAQCQLPHATVLQELIVVLTGRVAALKMTLRCCAMPSNILLKRPRVNCQPPF